MKNFAWSRSNSFLLASLSLAVSPGLISCSTPGGGTSRADGGTHGFTQRAAASVDPNFGRRQFTIGREDCVATQALPGFESSEDTIKQEDKTCEIHFTGPKVALCAAIGSTNPAVEVHELPEGMSLEKFRDVECKKTDDRVGKKLAKFKQSTSCSNTASILTYPKLAEALGVHVEIPNTVYRTMEISDHLEVQKLGTKYATSTAGQTWAGLVKQVKQKNPKVVKDDMIWGAMFENVRGETTHPTLNKRGSSNRAQPFMASGTWKIATAGKPIQELIMPKLEFLDSFVEVRDASEMTLIDHIMGQQDRFGNVAARNHIYWIATNADGTREAKSKSVKDANKVIDKNDPQQVTFLQKLKADGIPVNEGVQRMVMKDNDCGLRQGDNDARNNKMLASLRHFNPSVYANLQKIAARDGNEMREYFETQLLMSGDEAKTTWNNVLEAAKITRDNCKAGKLLLDLEVESFLNLAPAPQVACE